MEEQTKRQMLGDFTSIKKIMPKIEKQLDSYDELNVLHLERATSQFLTTLLNMGKFELVRRPRHKI
jgi:hypothetical protein